MSLEYSNKHRELEKELANISRLHFSSDKLEDAYSRQFIKNNRTRHRISCVIGIITLLLFMIQDLQTFPEQSKEFYLIIRAGICLPFFVLAFFVSQMPSMRRQLPYWIVTALLLLGLGSVAIVAINYTNNHVSPYEGILLTIIASYFLVGLDFRAASMCSSLIVISYLYVVVFIYEDSNMIYYNLSFVIVTAVICSVGGFGVEKQLRINFIKNEILTILSQRDGLTGIYNRATLEHKLNQTIRSSIRENIGIAFALIDVDLFKNYNDEYGHIAGDQCIRSIATALQKCCKRPTDFCARYGGEEFALIWYPTKDKSPEAMARAIKTQIDSLAIEHTASNISEIVTVSGGIVYFEPSSQISNDNIFNAADKALYLAKYFGRNQFKIAEYSNQ